MTTNPSPTPPLPTWINNSSRKRHLRGDGCPHQRRQVLRSRWFTLPACGLIHGLVVVATLLSPCCCRRCWASLPWPKTWWIMHVTQFAGYTATVIFATGDLFIDPAVTDYKNDGIGTFAPQRRTTTTLLDHFGLTADGKPTLTATPARC
jgi:hypothetical protein